jgi:hypothetical protein
MEHSKKTLEHTPRRVQKLNKKETSENLKSDKVRVEIEDLYEGEL